MIQNLEIKKRLTKRLEDESKRRTKTIFYLDDSSSWYIDETRARAYQSTTESEEYRAGMLDSERKLIETNIENIVSALPQKFNFLDLGPGTADKSKIILKHSLIQRKKVEYHALDISKKILEDAIKNVSAMGINTKGYLGNFETDIPLILQESQTPFFIYLGATYMNYEPEEILAILSESTQKSDSIYISTQKMYDEQEILKQYSTKIYPEVVDPLVQSLGIEDNTLNVRYENGTIEHYLKLKTVPDTLKYYAKENDEIVFFTSRKPTAEKFKDNTKEYFSGQYYENDKFIGLVGQPNSQ